MMNYIRYFQKYKYQREIDDCWTLVQEIFKDEQDIILPDCPIMTDYTEFAGYLKSNLKYKQIDKPHKGCLIYLHYGEINHAGYAISDKKFIHRTKSNVEVTNIPAKALIYEIYK